METMEEAQLELRRAYLLLEEGLGDEALAACDRAIVLASERPTPAITRGAILCALGKNKEALGSLRQARKRWPERALAHAHFAEALYFAGREKRARDILGQARECADAGEHAALIDALESFWDELAQLRG